MTTPRLLTPEDQRHALGVLSAAAASPGDPTLVGRYLDALTADEARAAAAVLALWLDWQIVEVHGPEGSAAFRAGLGVRIEACARREPR